jgi:hypothetical protein
MGEYGVRQKFAAETGVEEMEKADRPDGRIRQMTSKGSSSEVRYCGDVSQTVLSCIE